MSNKQFFWEQVFHKIGAPNEAIAIFLNTPYQTQFINSGTDLKSDRSCQRSILELCALKMTDSDREKIVGKVRDKLYKDLREPVRMRSELVGENPFKNISPEEVHRMSIEEIDEIRKPWIKWSATERCTFERIWYQAWYKTSEDGQIDVLESLYSIIRANPLSLCNMLRHKKDESKLIHESDSFVSTVSRLCRLPQFGIHGRLSKRQ